MDLERWTEVDDYMGRLLNYSDPVLEDVLQSSIEAEMPMISVSPAQGKFLNLLVKLLGAKKILEMGTLAAYSTIWMARALPEDGKLITLEYEPKHADVSERNIAKAGLSSKIEVRLGAALNTLPTLFSENLHPFDMIFIDADKENYPGYFEWALKLSRPGTSIVIDNVVRNGEIVEQNSEDPRVQGVRQMIELVSKEQRIRASVLQTVGNKGYDGFLLAEVIAT